MKRKGIWLISFVCIFVFSVAVCAVSAQGDLTDIEPLTINIEKISEQAASLLEDRLEELTAENEALKAQLEALTRRIEALEALAFIPTATPVPEGTLEPTPTPTRTPNPSGYDCEIFLASPYYFGEFRRGAEFNFTVRITNTGTKEWGNEVMMEWVSGLKAEKNPMYAFALPKSVVNPDEEIEFSIVMVAPSDLTGDGRYTAEYALSNDSERFCTFEYNIYVP